YLANRKPAGCRHSRKFSGCHGQRFGTRARGRPHGHPARERFSEIGKTVAAPEESFCMNVAILPAVLAAGFGVINNPVLRLAKGFHKGAVAHTPDLVSLLEDRPMLAPLRGIEHVRG